MDQLINLMVAQLNEAHDSEHLPDAMDVNIDDIDYVPDPMDSDMEEPEAIDSKMELPPLIQTTGPEDWPMADDIFSMASPMVAPSVNSGHEIEMEDGPDSGESNDLTMVDMPRQGPQAEVLLKLSEAALRRHSMSDCSLSDPSLWDDDWDAQSHADTDDGLYSTDSILRKRHTAGVNACERCRRLRHFRLSGLCTHHPDADSVLDLTEDNDADDEGAEPDPIPGIELPPNITVIPMTANDELDLRDDIEYNWDWVKQHLELWERRGREVIDVYLIRETYDDLESETFWAVTLNDQVVM